MPDVPRGMESRIIEAQIELLRLDAGTRRKVLRILEALRAELADALTAADPGGVARTEFQRRRLEVLMEQVDDLLRSRYREIAQTILDDMRGIGGHSVGVATAAVNTVVAANVLEPSIGAQDIRRMVNETVLDGGRLDEWLEQQAGRLRMRFLRTVRMGMLAQEPVAKIAQRIRGTATVPGIVDVSRREALALARGAVISIANRTRIESYFSSPAVRGLQWLSTLDTRTCQQCAALDGKIWDRDLKPIGHKFDFPGPIAHINCVTGDTVVASGSRLLRAYSGDYRGPVISIETTSGAKLSCTGNHPVLTHRGWVAAKLLHVGDDVVRCDVNGMKSPAKVYAEKVEARIEDVCRSFGELPGVVSVEVPSSAEDFHGDGRYHDVHVVRSYGNLSADSRESLAHRLHEVIFKLGGLGHRSLSRCGGAGHFVERLLSAARGIMGGHRHLGSLAWAHAGHPAPHGFASRRARDAESLMPSTEGDVADAELAAHLVGGGAGSVSLDRITAISVVESSVHVFNLETSDGWFTANGIVTHNCRCTQTPLMVSWDEMVRSRKLADALRQFEGDDATRASMGGQVPATLTYEEWLRKQSEKTQREVLGPNRLQLWRSGQISIDEMVDQSGRSLTLDQLRG